MNEQDPLLRIRFDGQAIGPGRIPVAHLLRFLSNLNKALQRTGRVLSGANESTSQGRPPRSIKEEIALDLVSLKEGSPSAVLGLERRQAEASFPQMDFGLMILESAVKGLNAVQDPEGDEPLPAGYDRGGTYGLERRRDAFQSRR